MIQNLNALIKNLKEMKDFATFNDKMFNEIVEQGSLYHNYHIEFKFKCGVVRTAYGWRRGKNPVVPILEDLGE